MAIIPIILLIAGLFMFFVFKVGIKAKDKSMDGSKDMRHT
jgi:hypothetical protein